MGLGNPIRKDDGVGCLVATALKQRLAGLHVDVTEASVAGLGLLDLITGYDKAIIIDAIQFENGIPGEVHRFEAKALPLTRHSGTPHDINLAEAVEIGRKLGILLPKRIVIYAIEAKDVTSFSEECTPEVRKAAAVCIKMIIQELKQIQSNLTE